MTPAKSSLFALLLCGFVAMLGSSCATGGPDRVRETLDLKTGVTITSSREPVIFYRDNPSSAAYARNLVHLGPIEINESGSHRYYLWLGIWNTLSGPEIADRRGGFDTVVIVADGEPLTLDVTGWTPAAIGVSAPVYLKPVAHATDAYYAVTLDQVRFMAESQDLRLRTTGSSPVEYRLWDDSAQARAGLRAFVDAVAF